MSVQDESCYISASKASKYAVIVWWICAIIVAGLIFYEMPRVFNPLAPPASFAPWWATISVFFMLSLSAGLYFLRVSVPAFIKREFPIQSARVPFKVKQRVGGSAIATAFLGLIIGMLLIIVPLVMISPSIKAVNSVKREHRQLIKLGVVPPDTERK